VGGAAPRQVHGHRRARPYPRAPRPRPLQGRELTRAGWWCHGWNTPQLDQSFHGEPSRALRVACLALSPLTLRFVTRPSLTDANSVPHRFRALVRQTLAPKKSKSKGGDGEVLDNAPKRILDGVSGNAQPGRLLAIMGRAGATRQPGVIDAPPVACLAAFWRSLCSRPSCASCWLGNPTPWLTAWALRVRVRYNTSVQKHHKFITSLVLQLAKATLYPRCVI
jgi:hypothetical protein